MKKISIGLVGIICICSAVSTVVARTNASTNNLELLISDAVNNVREINYIVSGDSTKEGRYEQTKQYYTEILNQLNIQYVDNAAGGLDLSEWITGIDHQSERIITETVNQAITQTPGLGENTILEFSLGINDYFRDPNLPEATLLATMISGLDTYIAARPNTVIILVSPVHFNADHSVKLNKIYAALALHYGFKLIDVEAITEPVYHTDNFYIDYVHPSAGGARRIVNYIMSQIVPPQYSNSIILPDYIPLEGVVNSAELAPRPEAGHYDVNTGNAYDSTWQRLPQFEVIPNRELTLVSSGNRPGIIFLDANETKIGESEQFHNSPSDPTLRVQIPSNAKYARANVHSNAGAITVSIKYSETPLQHMTVAEINQGLDINFLLANKVVPPSLVRPVKANVAISIQQADALFNGAETNYPQYFNSAQNTQVFSPDWPYYRGPYNNNSTSIFMGINVDNSVYVVGGSFGDLPMRVGTYQEVFFMVNGSKETGQATEKSLKKYNQQKLKDKRLRN
ncbi:MAG: SGNH/GDSL hydrolase family protein [Cocleimonas sp.]